MLPSYRAQVPLAPYTTFKTGGSAEYFTVVTSLPELEIALAEARDAGQPVTILGGGSNVLVADAGVTGCVIKNELQHWQVHPQAAGMVELTVGAGMVWDDLVARTVAEGWWGLENLSAIPGSVGATPIQNVGAYGVEVADRIVSVTAVHCSTGEERVFTAADCGFGYRDSFFKTPAGRAWVVVRVTYTLSTTPQPQLHYRDLTERFADTTPTQAAIRAAVIDIRAQKFPDWQRVGTAGSFFTNPIISRTQYQALTAQYPDLPGFAVGDAQVKVSLGWVLDKVCQLRGYYDGPVGCYEGQALVVVQTGGATSAAVAAFAAQVAARVRAATGIEIAWEVTPLS
jgi:UDP-N-acetylmuramate dehydrogenase